MAQSFQGDGSRLCRNKIVARNMSQNVGWDDRAAGAVSRCLVESRLGSVGHVVDVAIHFKFGMRDRRLEIFFIMRVFLEIGVGQVQARWNHRNMILLLYRSTTYKTLNETP